MTLKLPARRCETRARLVANEQRRAQRLFQPLHMQRRSMVGGVRLVGGFASST